MTDQVGLKIISVLSPMLSLVDIGDTFIIPISHGEGRIYIKDRTTLIKYIRNGQVVMQYSKPQLDPRDPNFQKLLPPDKNIMLSKGSISLQAESHPVDFRKVELLNLGDDCK